jgi:hypothetical protein
MDVLEIGARLTLLQSASSSTCSLAACRKTRTERKSCKYSSNRSWPPIVNQGRFTGPVPDDDKTEFQVHFQTVAENFFSRTDGFRGQLADAAAKRARG